MATDVTSIVDNGILRSWRVNPDDPMSPMGEMIYHGTTVIDAKASNDKALIRLRLNIPRDHAWRLVDFRLQLAASTGSILTDYEGGASFEINLSGVLTRVGQLLVPRALVSNNLLKGGGYVTDPDITLQLLEHFILDGTYDEAFRTVSDDDHIFLRLVNQDSTSATAGSLVHHCRLLQYSIDQFNAAPMHTPLPIITG